MKNIQFKIINVELNIQGNLKIKRHSLLKIFIKSLDFFLIISQIIHYFIIFKLLFFSSFIKKLLTNV